MFFLQFLYFCSDGPREGAAISTVQRGVVKGYHVIFGLLRSQGNITSSFHNQTAVWVDEEKNGALCRISSVCAAYQLCSASLSAAAFPVHKHNQTALWVDEVKNGDLRRISSRSPVEAGGEQK